MTDQSASARRWRIASVAQSHPIIGFFGFAFGISWAAWIPLFVLFQNARSIVMIPGAFGPALAAVAMIRLRGGSVRAWLAECADARIGARWYVVALCLPLGLGLALGAGFVAMSGSFELTRLVAAAPMYPLSVLVLALVGGGQEEFGWRGYALPTLQERLDALTASIVIGVAWAVWHLPAFLFEVPGYTRSFGLYALLVVGVSIILTWLYNATGGSVVAAMLLHGGINSAPSLGVAFVGGPSGLGVSPLLVLVLVVWVVALVLLLRHGRATLAGGSVGRNDRETPLGVSSPVVPAEN